MKNMSNPAVDAIEQPDWLCLDNWKTLYRASYPEPIREFQIITGYNGADSSLQVPDPEFMHVCLTTCSERVRNALRYERRVVEEDPGEFLWLVQSKLGFRASPGAERGLTELVEIEQSGLSKFVDVRLSRFKQRGIKLALASNGWAFPLPAIFNEDEGGLCIDDFDALLVSCEVGHAKPSAAFYEELVRRCSAPRHKILMAGDNPELDVRAALVAGINAVQVDHYGDVAAGKTASVDGVPLVRKLAQLPFARVHDMSDNNTQAAA